jgi:hypothetical protein
VLCTTLTLNLGNSLGASTIGVLFVGLARVDQPTSYDGRLLVLPSRVCLLPLPGAGLAFSGVLPCDDALCGLSVYLQVVEIDPGATKGASFTPGLRLLLAL